MPVVSTAHKSNSHSNHVGHQNGNGNPTTTSSSSTLTASNGTVANNNHGQQNPVNNHSGRSTGSTVQNGKKAATTKKTEPQKNDDNGNVQQRGGLDNQTGVSTNTTATESPHIVTNNSNNLYFGMLPGSGNPQMRLRTNSMSSTGSAGSHSSSISSIPSSAGSPSPISSSPISGDMFFKTRKSSDASSDNGPTSVAGFRQRLDLSAFASLPRNKQNPYHIRMEDTNTLAYAFASSCSVGAAKPQPLWEVAAEDGNCDVETRNFVLTNLLNKRMCSTRCVLCKGHLPVFDRFPLLDGTFFLSPQSYDEAAIQVS